MAETARKDYVIDIGEGEGRFPCRIERPVLTAMIEAGCSGVKVGCRNGGCGVCRIRVIKGTYDSQKMSRSRISEADEAAGIVLACRVFPTSDLMIEPLPIKSVGMMR